MRFVTIQHKSVFEKLMKNGEYSIENLRKNSSKKNLIAPYKFMAETLGYKHRPIFGCIVGTKYNFYGANTDGNVYIAEFNIPDKFVNVHAYYSWTDFIYFTEFPKELRDSYPSFKSPAELGRATLLNKLGVSENSEIEAVVEKLYSQWLIKVLPLTKRCNEILEDYELGRILQPLEVYERALREGL